jgi:hypothetical protein
MRPDAAMVVTIRCPQWACWKRVKINVTPTAKKNKGFSRENLF